MEVIRNSKKEIFKPKQIILNEGTHKQTGRQTDPCIELRYAHLINIIGWKYFSG